MKRLHVACWHFVDISVSADVRFAPRAAARESWLGKIKAQPSL
jgi:hypothetical protein